MKQIKCAIKAFAALILACVLMNGICTVYYHYPYWFDRSVNATLSVWRPKAFILQGKEGFGYHTVDGNGYVNEDLPLRGGMCLF